MTKIIHLENKTDHSHKYYGSVVAMFKNNALDVSKSKVEKYDWSKPLETKNFIIRKGVFVRSGN